MQSGLKLSVGAMLVSTALAGCASVQTSDQTAVNMAPGAVNEGTLAESANTTALATSTYHQPSGFLPGMKP